MTQDELYIEAQTEAQAEAESVIGMHGTDAYLPIKRILPQQGIRVRGPRWVAWGGFLHEGHAGEPCWNSLDGFHLLRMEGCGPFDNYEDIHTLVKIRRDAHPRLRLQVLEVTYDEVETKALALLMRVMEKIGAQVTVEINKTVMHLHISRWTGEPWQLPPRMDWPCWTVFIAAPL